MSSGRARRTTHWELADDFDPWPVFASVEEHFPSFMSDAWQYATKMVVDDPYGFVTSPTVAAAHAKWDTSQLDLGRLKLDASPRNPKASSGPVLKLEYSPKTRHDPPQLSAVVRAPTSNSAAMAISLIDGVIAEAAVSVSDARERERTRRSRWYQSAWFWHDPWVVGVGTALLAALIGVIVSVAVSR